MSSPLAGITVVSLEQAISAPLCTRHLADLGARVIKVENPAFGDSTRSYDNVVHGMSAHFVWLNHGKESAALDLADPADAAVFRRVLASADVFVSNLAPGALGRLDLDPADLVERHPRLIVVDISGYGSGGPSDAKRAYDLLIQAEAGACTITGWPGQPAKSGIPMADVSTALYAYSSVLAALYERERSGRGAVIPIAMFDVVAETMGFALNQVLHGQPAPVPVGMGSPVVAPYGAYETNDGQTAVLGTTNDREWARFANHLLQRPDLATDERYAQNIQRVQRRDELDRIIGAWCAERSLVDVQERAESAGIGNARLNSVSDLAAHPQLEQRHRWRSVHTPGGPVPALRPPAMATHWEVRDGAVPALGADTERVRAEFSGGVRGTSNAGHETK